jgi:hypothetical protein
VIRRLPFRWLERLDDLGHWLNADWWFFRRVCDAYEERLNLGPKGLTGDQ